MDTKFDTQTVHDTIVRTTEKLSVPWAADKMQGRHGVKTPSIEELKHAVALVKAVLFPTYFDKRRVDPELRQYYIGVNMEQLFDILRVQVRRGLLFAGTEACESDLRTCSDRIATGFIDHLPELRRVLYTDVEAVAGNDPAVTSLGEVIFCYPGVQAMINYRMAHSLLQMGVPIIPRIITEMAHSVTGIDIHPGAQIGEYFAIDHGTGVVIGETCVIGKHVTIYQGVTLGARNFSYDDSGLPRNIPRHPIIEDNVTIYSNASVLGRITVGHDSVVGGNVWLTTDVPPFSRVLQSTGQTIKR